MNSRNIEILKLLRKEAGMSKIQFVEYFGIPMRTFEDWERGSMHLPDFVLKLFIYKLEQEKLIETHPDWTGFEKSKDQIKPSRKM